MLTKRFFAIIKKKRKKLVEDNFNIVFFIQKKVLSLLFISGILVLYSLICDINYQHIFEKISCNCTCFKLSNRNDCFRLFRSLFAAVIFIFIII